MSKLIQHMGEEWYELLKPIIETDYFNELGKKVIPGTFDTKIIYPSKENVFKAFKLCPVNNTKVVIIGDEPYYDGNATGLAFGNKDLLKVSTSLTNIFKEIENDIYDGFKLDQDPDLTRWAEQGVLLINTALTVEKDKPGSHKKYWNKFIKEVVSKISQTNPCIFMLWGDNAKEYIDCIVRESNIILTSECPTNEKFLGSDRFSSCNEVLEAMGHSTIEW